MATEKQIEANRRNALKSTGPRTEEGRAAVRFNGLKHGLSAKSLCLPGDDPEELDAFLDNYEADYCPINQTEAELVMQIAMATWRLRRFRRVEAAHFAAAIEDHKSYIHDCHPEWNDDAKIAFVLGTRTTPERYRICGAIKRSGSEPSAPPTRNSAASEEK